MRKVNHGGATLPEILHGDEMREAKAELADHYRLDSLERARRRPPLNPKIWLAATVFGEEGRHEPDLCKKGRWPPSYSASTYAARAALLEQGRRLLSGNAKCAR
ncbi:glycine/D-amino acid oxidase-like deaminating enzyme [Acidovorax delafieldii]|nr:glycine/D-amino acid oxidase-like deaminating enzyme [Acidovorax delafieldii]